MVRTRCPGRGWAWLIGCCLLPAFLTSPPAVRAGDADLEPPEDGFLLLEGVRASDSVYRWEDDLLPGRRCLVWPGGCLVLAEATTVEEFGGDAILVPFSTELRGVGAGGALAFIAGAYPVRDSLLLHEGSTHLFLSDGVLEIRAGRLTYSPGSAVSPERRGQYLILGGVAVAVFLLMARARRRLREV